MKQLIGILLLTLFAAACNNATEQEAKKEGQEIFFSETTHDYGEIKKGEDGRYAFEFKNIGDQPIVINKVRTTCGCTATQWSGDPIEPGESGKITIKYNTALVGSFMKTSYVYSSAANSPVKLTIKGKVVEQLAVEERMQLSDTPEMK
jgi:hypothetical protein